MNRLIFCIFFIAVSLAACRDFIEPSVEGRKVVLLAPGNNSEDSIYTPNFWWEPVNDALSYRLQVVSPSFDSINRMIADTLIEDNKFELTLDPGQYSWRVRAENGSSKSFYTTFCFTIH